MESFEVHYEPGAAEFAAQLFGRAVADEELSLAVGALDGSRLRVKIRKGVELSVEVTHPKVAEQVRFKSTLSFCRNYDRRSGGVEMTISDLMKTWTLEDFYCLKSLGFLAASTTYDEFLAMKLEQAELARRQKIELFGEDLDDVPYEEPPDMTPEEEAEDAARKLAWEAALREVRARMAAEQETGAAVRAA